MGFSVSASLLLLFMIALAPSIKQDSQHPTFRSGVEVALIDVSVVDRSHAPVRNLTVEDFAVLVDNRPRRVVSAQFISYEINSVKGGRERAPRPSPALPGLPVPARNVLLVVDTDSMEPGDGQLLRREASAFVDNLAPDDRVAVLTIPWMKSEVSLSNNREAAKTALSSIVTGSAQYRSVQYSIGLWEALETERDPDVMEAIKSRECGTGRGRAPSNGWCRGEVQKEVDLVRQDAHLRGERSLVALRDIGQALARLTGPKTLVLVSGGMPRPDGTPGAWYSRVGDAFVSAEVSLYTIYVEQPGSGQTKYRTSPSAARDRLADLEGVENSTSAAGGTLFEAIGTLDQYFGHIVSEMSGSYLLGLEVESSDRDGKFHQVSVKVQRRGVEVRARRRYVIRPEK